MISDLRPVRITLVPVAEVAMITSGRLATLPACRDAVTDLKVAEPDDSLLDAESERWALWNRPTEKPRHARHALQVRHANTWWRPVPGSSARERTLPSTIDSLYSSLCRGEPHFPSPTMSASDRALIAIGATAT